MPKAAPPVFDRPTKLAMLGVNLMVLTATLDMSVVNVSLPTLAEKLDADFALVEWVVLSYVLVIACLLLLVSRLGDMRGKKSIFATGLLVFTAGSLACGAAPSIGWLIAARALQGVGGAMSQALGIAIITEIAPSGARGKAIGVVGATVSVGLALGPSLGGVLIGLAGWRSVFLINLPVCLAAYVMVRRFVPDLPPKTAGQRFDPLGAALAVIALGGYTLGMTLAQNHGFGDPTAQILLGVSAAAFLAFLVVELRVAHPMIDLSLFRNILFGLNLLMGVMVFISLAGNFIMPFLLQNAQGRSIIEVGFMMMIVPAFMGLVAPLAGSLSDSRGSREISLAGLLLMALGCYLTGGLGVHSPWWEFVLRTAPIGLGAGLFQAPNNSAVMGAVPPDRLGVASGLLNYSRIFGQTTGLPLIGVIFAALATGAAGPHAGMDFTKIAPEALVAGVTGAYRIQALFLLAACLPAGVALYIDKRRRAGA